MPTSQRSLCAYYVFVAFSIAKISQRPHEMHIVILFLTWANKAWRFWEPACSSQWQTMDLDLRQFQSSGWVFQTVCTDLGNDVAGNLSWIFVVGLRRLCHLLLLRWGQSSKMIGWLHKPPQHWREMALFSEHRKFVLVQLWFWLKSWIVFSPRIEGVDKKIYLLNS